MTRRQRRLQRLGLTAGAILAVFAAIGVIVAAQKQAERNGYLAVRSGPSCRSVAKAPDFVARADLRALSFGGARFQYLRGDADCQTVRPGRLFGDRALPVCLFDRPGFVAVEVGATRAAYVAPFGQTSILIEAAKPHCVLQAAP